jgi:hypothetical protein
VKGRVRITILESFVGRLRQKSPAGSTWLMPSPAQEIKPAVSAPATEPDEECDVKLPVSHKGSESGYVTSLQAC